jgi:hypothetical protein
MNRLRLLGTLAVVLAGCLALGGRAAGGEKERPHKHDGHFDKCAKACAECMRECESCATHCAHMVAQGKKDHMRTLQTCKDCAEFCAAAGRIVARRGPMAVLICEPCAKACDVCGKACERFPDDKHMERCARECRDCARACREMISHAKHDKDQEK